MYSCTSYGPDKSGWTHTQTHTHTHRTKIETTMSHLPASGLDKTKFAILVSLVRSMLLKDLHSELILASLQLVLCRMTEIKRFSIYHHSADYIFWSFGLIRFIRSQFENKVPLQPVLVDVGSVAPLHYCT